MAKVDRELSPDEQLRFMRGVRLAAGVFRSVETLGKAGVVGGGLCEIQACFRPGMPQVRVMSPALETIGDDDVMLAGFDAALTDFINTVLSTGAPGLEFYEAISYRDVFDETSSEARCVDTMFRESVGLAEGAAHG